MGLAHYEIVRAKVGKSGMNINWIFFVYMYLR